MVYVYVLQNLVSLKIYVGISKNPKSRQKGHFYNAFSQKPRKNRLYDAMRKYGKEAFSFTVIEKFESQHEAAVAEEFWIEFFRSWDPSFGYNMSFGGELQLPTLQTRQRMSESAKRRGSNTKGKKFSDEARENISKAHKKRLENGWEEKTKRGFEKRSQNPEWRKSLSECAKKRLADPAMRKRISEKVKEYWRLKKAEE